jgi:hypothetical protein
MRLLQLLMLALLATAVSCHADQIYGFLACSAGMFEGQFVFPPDLGLIGDAGPCSLTLKPGEPTEISWHAVFPLQVSEVFTELGGSSSDKPWSFSADVLVTTELPITGNIDGLDTEFGVGVHSEISGTFCPFDGPCTPFFRKGQGMGQFLFTSNPSYCDVGPDFSCLYSADVGLFEVPEPSSLLLLATAAGIALLMSRSRRIAHNLRLRTTRRPRQHTVNSPTSASVLLDVA